MEERGNFSDPKISCRCLPLETVIRSQISGKRREGWGQKPFEVFSKIHPILGTEAPLNFKNESLSKVAFDFHLPISITMMEIEKISFCHGRDSLTCVAVSLLSPVLHGNYTLAHSAALKCFAPACITHKLHAKPRLSCAASGGSSVF